MTRTKSSRALVSVVLAVLMAVAFMPAISYTSFAATAKKATKVTKVYHKANTTYTRTVGSAWTLKYKLSPSKLTSAAKKVVWKSSNSKVAKVSTQKGNKAIVSFNKTGSATVTVYTKANKKAKATWKFKVVKEADKTTTLTGVTVSAPNAKDPASEVKVGTTLKANVAPEDAAGVTYQWYADGTAIEGATKASFTVTTDQIGKAISVKAKSKNEVESAKTATVAAVNVDSVAVQKKNATGKYENLSDESSVSVDDALKAVVKAGTDDASNAVSVQWYYRDNVNGNTVDTPISGATSAEYTVTTDALSHNSIVVKVTPKSGVTFTSAATTMATKVYSISKTAKPAIAANGKTLENNATVKLGTALTATTTPASASSDFTYEWMKDGKIVANTADYTPSVEGEYTVVITAKSGAKFTADNTTAAKVTVSKTAGTKSFSTAKIVEKSGSAFASELTSTTVNTALTAGAVGVSDSNAYTVQWYYDTKDNNGNVTKNPISGAASAEYTPNDEMVGKTVYAILTGTGEYAGSTATTQSVFVSGTFTAKDFSLTKTENTYTLAATTASKLTTSDYSVVFKLVDKDGKEAGTVNPTLKDGKYTYTLTAGQVAAQYSVKAEVTGQNNYKAVTAVTVTVPSTDEPAEK